MEKKKSKIEYLIQDGDPFDLLTQEEIDNEFKKFYMSLGKDKLKAFVEKYPKDKKDLERLNLLYLLE